MKKVFLVLLVLVSACAVTSKMIPTAENLEAMRQKVPGITLEEANQGYTLYKSKCSGCHRLHAPLEYTTEKWQKTLKEMFPKVKMITSDERVLIERYLYSLSK